MTHARSAVLCLMAREVAAHVDTITAHWDILLDEAQTAGPHRQRTGINKLRTAANIVESVGGGKELRRLLKPLKAWQKSLGGVRDLDVLREWLGMVGPGAPARAQAGFDLLTERLVELRRARLNELVPHVLGATGAHAQRALSEVRAWAASTLADANGSLPPVGEWPLELAHEIAGLLLAPLVQPWLDRRSEAAAAFKPEALHEFRLANKRVRDAADVMARAIDPETWTGVRDRTQALHRALGNLNDLAVLDVFVTGERARQALLYPHDARRSGRLARANAALDGERQRQLATLYELWPGLFEQPFEAALRAAVD